MGFNDAMSGYKKLSNSNGYEVGDVFSLMKRATYSFGEPKLGTVAKKDAVIFENVGRFTVYVQVSPKSIEIGRVIEKSLVKNVFKELGAAILTDANAKDTAVADRAVEELFEVIDGLLNTGVVKNESGSADSIKLYMQQKFWTIADKFSICDVNQTPKYLVAGNLLSLGFKIEDESGNSIFDIKKKLVAVMPEYTIKQNGEDVGYLKKKIKLVKSEISGEIHGKPVEIKGDLSGYHFSIQIQGVVVGSVDTERLTWGDVYSIDIRDEAQKDIVVATAVIVDNILKAKD